MTDIYLTIDKKENRIWWSTVNYGHSCKLIAENPKFLVIKVPGQHYASGQMRPYSKAHTVVLSILASKENRNGHFEYVCTEAITWSRDDKSKI